MLHRREMLKQKHFASNTLFLKIKFYMEHKL